LKRTPGTITGGYLDAEGTPTATLLREIEFVDASIAQMVRALKSKGIYDSTLIVITAKHGQSPIDSKLYYPLRVTPEPTARVRSLSLAHLSFRTRN
jgi:hypothetical protein